ncbi:DUF1850 domain-containing protein [Skermanella sp. TT6]|uniref:DUF1850 domain-containing protein n=1 Tax=Skermanella cutis TaxID=2775420 RepID=A0ABX7BF51_9PROT|nr:DUF1850 domain-containing protein [Skermanella sp. TT6]QQP92220.1 DUF1850 domain-containing protein [Skermanella sp. TT6]
MPAPVTALCIALAGASAAGAPLARLPVEAFSLGWTHSVERIEWREDWRISDGRLLIEEARVRGSGAGMEVPEGAKLVDGSWVYRPGVPPLDRLDLANSGFTADYRICSAEGCRDLAVITGVADRPLTLFACPAG